MNTQCIRFQELELKDFKNTENGVISMPSTISKDSFNYKSDILGIYGQNGTGKSSIIEAMNLIMHLFSQNNVQKDYSRYIAKGKQTCQLRADFLLQKNDFKAYIEYSVHLKHAENKKSENEEEKENNPIFISFERMRYRRWNNEKQKFSRITELFSFDANKPKTLNNEQQLKKLIEQNDETQIEIALAIASAQTQRRSILMSQQFEKLLSQLNDAKTQDTLLIVNTLRNYARFDTIVVLNEQLAISNLVVPFFIRQVHQDKLTSGRVPVALNGTILLPETFEALLHTPIRHVNKVLESLIPGLQIELRNWGNEMNEKGNICTRVQLLSHRGEVVIPLQCESAGIIKIVSILSALLHVFHNASVCLIVDELDAGIFEYLLGEILATLDMHAKGQIIFTSHNLRALEMLRKESLMFSTTNPENRYIRMVNVKKSNNLRDQYYRAIQLGGQSEELYAATDSVATAKAFRQAIITSEQSFE